MRFIRAFWIERLIIALECSHSRILRDVEGVQKRKTIESLCNAEHVISLSQLTTCVILLKQWFGNYRKASLERKIARAAIPQECVALSCLTHEWISLYFGNKLRRTQVIDYRYCAHFRLPSSRRRIHRESAVQTSRNRTHAAKLG